jgi:transposase
MPALVATRFNVDLKAEYQALVTAGKPPKVAITAIMRKLIILANTSLNADWKWIYKAA